MISPSFLAKAGLTLAVLLLSLGFVTWRQSRALEVLRELEDVRRASAEMRAEQVDLERGIQALESRSRVVPLARERLNMHTPDASELVILPGEPIS
ncbi:MAG: cell division protein FtsL [Gemmatimonadota bacterium]|nr:cell division protein FtsL [Gemmatimonadota bacterium]